MFDLSLRRLMTDLQFTLRYVRVALNFDSKFYSSKYPDVRSSGMLPLLHYLRFGAKELRDPNAAFSATFYLENNSDVRSAGVDPFVHFVLWGRAEGRAGAPPQAVEQADACEVHDRTENKTELDQQAELIRNDFDPDFYLSRYSDVSVLNVDPVLHYLQHGAAELRDPSSSFSTAYYLESNPDVAEAGINPLLHFVTAGRQEGRLPQSPGGFRARHLRDIVPLEEVVQRWRIASKAAVIQDVEVLREKLFGIFDTGRTRAVLSIGHDDYRAHTGGVQFCIEIEARAFKEAGTVYFNLHPAQPLPVLANAAEHDHQPIAMVIDGKDVGIARARDIIEIVGELASRNVSFSTAVHALHGHTTEFVQDLVIASCSTENLYWVHDYFSVCPGYTLLRNDVSYCGAPPIESQACAVCVYGEKRAEHLARMKELFSAVPFKVVAPSELALEIWRAGSNLRGNSEMVSAHCRLDVPKGSNPAEDETREKPVRVAFLGHPAMHKGWPIFENLVQEVRADQKISDCFEFFYFGSQRLRNEGITSVPTTVSMQNPHAMVTAIAAAQIDFVFLWSLWPETFSFTAHEGLAAGAYILTGADSGNIARLADETGRVFEHEDDLLSFFRSGDASRLAARRRSQATARDLVFGRMSADVLR